MNPFDNWAGFGPTERTRCVDRLSSSDEPRLLQQHHEALLVHRLDRRIVASASNSQQCSDRQQRRS